MSVTELAPARERRAVRARAEQMQRAAATVLLAVDDLPPRDQLLVLNYTLEQKLQEARAADVIGDR